MVDSDGYEKDAERQIDQLRKELGETLNQQKAPVMRLADPNLPEALLNVVRSKAQEHSTRKADLERRLASTEHAWSPADCSSLSGSVHHHAKATAL